MIRDHDRHAGPELPVLHAGQRATILNKETHLWSPGEIVSKCAEPRSYIDKTKFCSTTALREAIRWKRASEVVFCQLRHGARMSSFVVGEDTQSIPFGNHHIRRCMGMWLSYGLHHMWCGAGQCYFVSEECACKFCGCAGVDKIHLLRCEWASCEQMNMDNIQQIVRVMCACNRHT